MNDLVGLFDALYARLLLRDTFAKVIPGLLVIFSFLSLLLSIDESVEIARTMSGLNWLSAFGVAWVVAFSLQSFGEWAHLIQYHDVEWNDKDFYVLRIKFDRVATDKEAQQFERFAVIKEACGNGYLAIGLLILCLALDGVLTHGLSNVSVGEILRSLPIAVFIAALLLFLRRMHFVHVKRQSEYMTEVLNNPSGEAKSSN